MVELCFIYVTKGLHLCTNNPIYVSQTTGKSSSVHSCTAAVSCRLNQTHIQCRWINPSTFTSTAIYKGITVIRHSHGLTSHRVWLVRLACAKVTTISFPNRPKTEFGCFNTKHHSNWGIQHISMKTLIHAKFHY